jgi:hypothetical protein
MSVVSLVTSIVYGYRDTSSRFGHGLTVMNVRIRGRPTSRKIAMVGANRRGDEAYWKTLASVRCQAFRRKSSVGLYVQVTTENEVGHLNRRKRFTSKNPPWPSLAFVEVLVFKLVSQLNVAEGVVSGQNVGISQRRHDDYTFTPGRDGRLGLSEKKSSSKTPVDHRRKRIIVQQSHKNHYSTQTNVRFVIPLLH